MTETVNVKSVQQNGAWFEIDLEDGRKVSTKSQKLAEAANANRGAEVEADITTQQKGNFTNHYVNMIAGVKDGFKKATKKAATNGGTSTATPMTDDRSNAIQHQWAMGRAVELLVGSDAEYTFPLDDATRDQLIATRDFLLGTVPR